MHEFKGAILQEWGNQKSYLICVVIIRKRRDNFGFSLFGLQEQEKSKQKSAEYLVFSHQLKQRQQKKRIAK